MSNYYYSIIIDGEPEFLKASFVDNRYEIAYFNPMELDWGTYSSISEFEQELNKYTEHQVFDSWKRLKV